jgi:hypothetical protein
LVAFGAGLAAGLAAGFLVAVAAGFMALGDAWAKAGLATVSRAALATNALKRRFISSYSSVWME